MGLPTGPAITCELVRSGDSSGGYDSTDEHAQTVPDHGGDGQVSVAACRRQQQATSSSTPPPTPGAPPAFGTAPGSGPDVSPATFAEAEKLVQVTMTDAEREMAAGNWRRMMAPLLERRVGPRKVALEPDVAPATRWDPRITGASAGPAADRFVRSRGRHGSSALERRRHRVRARHEALALDRSRSRSPPSG